MSQKDAVFSAIVAVLNANGINFIVGKNIAANLLTKEMRAQVTNNLINSFTSGETSLKEESKLTMSDESVFRAYVSSLVSNWLRKDSRLNGGVGAPSSKKSTAQRPQVSLTEEPGIPTSSTQF
jgi:hypothetical protein